jgi:hypothetical protein
MKDKVTLKTWRIRIFWALLTLAEFRELNNSSCRNQTWLPVNFKPPSGLQTITFKDKHVRHSCF